MKNLPKTPAQQAGKAQGWMEDIKEVVHITSVEEFWGVYNNIVGPSVLGQRADYYLFKNGIIPAWEDPANKHGGKWSVQMPREKTRPKIDEMWLNMVSRGRRRHHHLQDLSHGPRVRAPADARCDRRDIRDRSRGAGKGGARGRARFDYGCHHQHSSQLVSPPKTALHSPQILIPCTASYRLNIWTRTAPAEPSEPCSLRSRIELIGKHFKTTVLGFQLEQKIATGAGAGFTTEMEFASHKDSEKKHNTRKIAL